MELQKSYDLKQASRRLFAVCMEDRLGKMSGLRRERVEVSSPEKKSQLQEQSLKAVKSLKAGKSQLAKRFNPEEGTSLGKDGEKRRERSA